MRDILYVDMDGVVADFNKKLIEICPDMINLQGVEKASKIDEVCFQNRNIFRSLEPMMDSVETISKLNNIFDIYFLSTPMWELPESFSDKRHWIGEYFPEIGVKKLILSHRKDLNIGKYLIDDRIKHGVDKFTGEHIHFGTNKFPTWKSVYNYLTLNS